MPSSSSPAYTALTLQSSQCVAVIQTANTFKPSCSEARRAVILRVGRSVACRFSLDIQ